MLDHMPRLLWWWLLLVLHGQTRLLRPIVVWREIIIQTLQTEFKTASSATVVAQFLWKTLAELDKTGGRSGLYTLKTKKKVKTLKKNNTNF
jgi:hypothetical protein